MIINYKTVIRNVCHVCDIRTLWPPCIHAWPQSMNRQTQASWYIRNLFQVFKIPLIMNGASFSSCSTKQCYQSRNTYCQLCLRLEWSIEYLHFIEIPIAPNTGWPKTKDFWVHIDNIDPGQILLCHQGSWSTQNQSNYPLHPATCYIMFQLSI